MRRAATVLILLLAAGALFLLLRGGGPEVGPPEIPTAPPEPQKEADVRIRPFRYTYTVGGRTVLEVTAAEARTFQETGRTLLLDLEQASFVDEEDRRYVFTAREGSRREAESEFRLTGQVRGEILKPGQEEPILAIETEELIFAMEKREARAPGPVRLTREGIQTDARTLRVDGVERKVFLDGDVYTRVDRLPAEGSAARDPRYPVEVRAPRFRFDPASGLAEYLDGPEIRYGESTAHGERLVLRTSEAERRIELLGDVHLRIQAAQSETPAPSRPTRAPVEAGNTPEIPEPAAAEWIEVTSQRLEGDLASNLLVFPTRTRIDRGTESLEADRLEILFQGEAGELAGAIATGDVRGSTAGDRRVRCGRAVLDRIRETLLLTEEPVVLQGRSRLRSESIKVFLDRDLYLLEGGLQGVYIPDPGTTGSNAPGEEDAPALFRMASGGPVTFAGHSGQVDGESGRARFEGDVEIHRGEESLYTDLVLADFDPRSGQIQELHSPGALRYVQLDRVLVADAGTAHPDEGWLELEGRCKAFQGRDSTRAERMKLYLEEDRAEAWDDVETYLENVRLLSEEEEDEDRRAPLTVRSEWAEFDDAESRVTYRGKVDVRQRDLWIQAEELIVHLHPGTRGVRDIRALRNVRLQRGELRAQCHDLSYDQQEEIVVLLGDGPEPARIQQADRSAAGERITIELGSRIYRVESGETVMIPQLGTPSEPEGPDREEER